MNSMTIWRLIQDILSTLGIQPGTSEAKATYISMLVGFCIGVVLYIIVEIRETDLSFGDYCKFVLGLTFQGLVGPLLILFFWGIFWASPNEPGGLLNDYNIPKPPVRSFLGFICGAIFWLLLIPLGIFTLYLIWKVTISVKWLFNILIRNWVPKSRS